LLESVFSVRFELKFRIAQIQILKKDEERSY